MTQEAMRAALGAHKDVFYQSKKRKSASTTPSVPNAAFVPPEGMSRNGVSTYTRETQAGGSGERIHVMPATVNEARNDGHDDDVFSGQMPRPPQPLPSSGDLVKDKFVKVFARMAYFMRSEQGYFGCSIVGFCKGVKFFFARVFWYGSKSMAAKALRGYMTVLEYEEVRVSTPDTTNLSSKWQRVKEAYQQMKQDTLLKLAAKVKPKPSEDQNTPQKIIVNVWDFFHKEYGAALVLLDQDGYMATVKDQDVTSALKRIGEELKPEGTVSFGTYSRRAPIDELLKGLRLPEMGASWDNWQLFAYERSDQACVTAATLRGGNVTDGHMQFPRMHGIVTQLNQDASGETVSDDVRHHFFPFSLSPSGIETSHFHRSF